MILRPYQERALAELHHHLALGEHPLLAAPCGAGKTEIAARLAADLALPTLWLAHRIELVDQAATRLRAAGLDVGLLVAGGAIPATPVVVASLQTAVRRTLPAYRLAIHDEAHHVASDSWAALARRLPAAHHIGLTATPYRLDGRPLGALFSRLIVACQPSALVEAGVLARPRVFAAAAPPARFHVRAGDFAHEEVEAAVNRPGLVADIVRTWQRLADRRKTICFAASVAHSEAIVARFQAAGHAARHLDGSTPAEERHAILAAWRGGTVQVVANCSLIAEGFDLPDIGAAILARPTQSLALHVQQCGRALRSAPGKTDALILDHAGNVARLGWPTQDVPVSLDEGITDRAERKERLPAVRRCPSCLAVAEGSPAACPECGRAYPVKAVVPVERAGELTEQAPFEVRRAAWDAIEAERIARGWKEGYSAVRYHEKFGAWPTLAGRELIEARDGDSRLSVAWAALQAEGRAKNYAPGWAWFRFKGRYGVEPPRKVSVNK